MMGTSPLAHLGRSLAALATSAPRQVTAHPLATFALVTLAVSLPWPPVALSLACLLALVLVVRDLMTPPLVHACRRARRRLGRPPRPDEALADYLTAAGLDPSPTKKGQRP